MHAGTWSITTKPDARCHRRKSRRSSPHYVDRCRAAENHHVNIPRARVVKANSSVTPTPFACHVQVDTAANTATQEVKPTCAMCNTTAHHDCTPTPNLSMLTLSGLQSAPIPFLRPNLYRCTGYATTQLHLSMLGLLLARRNNRSAREPMRPLLLVDSVCMAKLIATTATRFAGGPIRCPQHLCLRGLDFGAPGEQKAPGEHRQRTWALFGFHGQAGHLVGWLISNPRRTSATRAIERRVELIN